MPINKDFGNLAGSLAATKKELQEILGVMNSLSQSVQGLGGVIQSSMGQGPVAGASASAAGSSSGKANTDLAEQAQKAFRPAAPLSIGTALIGPNKPIQTNAPANDTATNHFQAAVNNAGQMQRSVFSGFGPQYGVQNIPELVANLQRSGAIQSAADAQIKRLGGNEKTDVVASALQTLKVAYEKNVQESHSLLNAFKSAVKEFGASSEEAVRAQAAAVNSLEALNKTQGDLTQATKDTLRINREGGGSGGGGGGFFNNVFGGDFNQKMAKIMGALSTLTTLAQSGLNTAVAFGSTIKGGEVDLYSQQNKMNSRIAGNFARAMDIDNTQSFLKFYGDKLQGVDSRFLGQSGTALAEAVGRREVNMGLAIQDYEHKGKLAGAVGDVIQKALMGAAMGSVIPGLGNAIGASAGVVAGIGGALGAVTGVASAAPGLMSGDYLLRQGDLGSGVRGKLGGVMYDSAKSQSAMARGALFMRELDTVSSIRSLLQDGEAEVLESLLGSGHQAYTGMIRQRRGMVSALGGRAISERDVMNYLEPQYSAPYALRDMARDLGIGKYDKQTNPNTNAIAEGANYRVGKVSGHIGSTTPTGDDLKFEKFTLPFVGDMAGRAGGFYNPLGTGSPLTVTSDYGLRKPQETKNGRASLYHPGVDFKAPSGTSVFSMHGGVISKKALGYMVQDDELGVRSFYYHINRNGALKNGERIERGQFLGSTQMDGDSTAAHLHIEEERKIDGRWVKIDPINGILSGFAKGTGAESVGDIKPTADFALKTATSSIPQGALTRMGLNTEEFQALAGQTSVAFGAGYYTKKDVFEGTEALLGLTRGGLGSFDQITQNLVDVNRTAGGTNNINNLYSVMSAAVSAGFDKSRLAQEFVVSTTELARSMDSTNVGFVGRQLGGLSGVLGINGTADELSMSKARQGLAAYTSISAQTGGAIGSAKLLGTVSSGAALGEAAGIIQTMSAPEMSAAMDELNSGDIRSIKVRSAIQNIMTNRKGVDKAKAIEILKEQLQGGQSGAAGMVMTNLSLVTGGKIRELFDAAVKDPSKANIQALSAMAYEGGSTVYGAGGGETANAAVMTELERAGAKIGKFGSFKLGEADPKRLEAAITSGKNTFDDSVANKQNEFVLNAIRQLGPTIVSAIRESFDPIKAAREDPEGTKPGSPDKIKGFDSKAIGTAMGEAFIQSLKSQGFGVKLIQTTKTVPSGGSAVPASSGTNALTNPDGSLDFGGD